jgi:hypothetical protein
MENERSLAITAILATAVLAGIFAMVTTSIQANAEKDYGDNSETETNQKNRINGAASGFGQINNCAENNIESPHGTGISNYPHCTASLG